METEIADWAMRRVRAPAELSAWAHLRMVEAHVEAMEGLKAGGLLRLMAADLAERWPEARPETPFLAFFSAWAREHYRPRLQP